MTKLFLALLAWLPLAATASSSAVFPSLGFYIQNRTDQFIPLPCFVEFSVDVFQEKPDGNIDLSLHMPNVFRKNLEQSFLFYKLSPEEYEILFEGRSEAELPAKVRELVFERTQKNADGSAQKSVVTLVYKQTAKAYSREGIRTIEISQESQDASEPIFARALLRISKNSLLSIELKRWKTRELALLERSWDFAGSCSQLQMLLPGLGVNSGDGLLPAKVRLREKTQILNAMKDPFGLVCLIVTESERAKILSRAKEISLEIEALEKESKAKTEDQKILLLAQAKEKSAEAEKLIKQAKDLDYCSDPSFNPKDWVSTGS